MTRSTPIPETMTLHVPFVASADQERFLEFAEGIRNALGIYVSRIGQARLSLSQVNGAPVRPFGLANDVARAPTHRSGST